MIRRAGNSNCAHWIAARQSAPLLMRFGSEAQRQAFLPRIAAGEEYQLVQGFIGNSNVALT